MINTAPATVQVLDVTMLPGRRRLIGLAQVKVILDGVAIVFQGARIIRRRADGLSSIESPLLPAYGWLMPHGYLPH